MLKYETLFFELALKSDALLLGDFILKSGQNSPYFFNVGSFFNQGFIAELSNLGILLRDKISSDKTLLTES